MLLSSSSISLVMLAQLPAISTVAETFTRARITTRTNPLVFLGYATRASLGSRIVGVAFPDAPMSAASPS
jgi:hypothetical protein